jgi:large-conductance mechanosensitive channel
MIKDVENVLRSESFKSISDKIFELLVDASKGFGSSNNAFCMFCLYLLNSDNLKYKIEGVYPGIQLLLTNPHSFWPPSLYDYDLDKAIKVKIIKLFIGFTLLHNYTPSHYSLINKKEITGFLAQKCQALKGELAGQPIVDLLRTPFNKIYPYRERNNSKDNYVWLSFLTCFAASIFMGYKAGWYFVGKIVLNKIELDYDKIDRRIENGALLVVTFSIVSLIAATSVLGFFLLDRFFPKIYKDKYFADWQVVNISEFIGMSIQTGTPLPLNKEKPNNVLKIWNDWSHLDTLTANKSPIRLRAYFQYELHLLQSSMDFKDFCKLLICLLFDSEAIISDVPYAVASDFLRQPESWVTDTKLSQNKCKAFLQAYIKLAIVEYLLEELNDKDVMSRAQIVTILTEKRASIVQELDTLNRKPLKYKITAIDPIVTATVMMILMPVYMALVFYFKYHHLKGNEAEKLPAHPTETDDLGHYFVAFIPFILFALIHRCAVKLIDVAINRESKKNMSMQFFTDKTLRETPRLQVLEQESTLAAIC